MVRHAILSAPSVDIISAQTGSTELNSMSGTNMTTRIRVALYAFDIT